VDKVQKKLSQHVCEAITNQDVFLYQFMHLRIEKTTRSDCVKNEINDSMNTAVLSIV